MTSVASLPARLEKLVGSDRVRTSESELQDFAIAGHVPTAILKPQSGEEVAEIVRLAATEKLAVVCCGSRSKLDLGMPPQRYDLALDMTALRQIVHYDPGDLTLSVDAGITLQELAKALAAKNQFLPLAMPCQGTSTIGGAVVSGIDSTMRQQYGTPRDFLIGAEFVDGKGQLCKSGGRVVKNVTGYDLHKLLIGSLGTLAAVTRLNFRTFPLPELRGGHLASFATLEAAFAFRKILLDSGLPFSNLELFDPDFSALLAEFVKNAEGGAPEMLAAPNWNVFAAFGGNEAVVQRIERELQKHSKESRAEKSGMIEGGFLAQIDDALREAFAWLRHAAPGGAVCRIVLPQFSPRDTAELLQLSRQAQQRTCFLMRAAGVAYLALLGASEDESGIDALQRAVSQVFSRVGEKNGSATLSHAPNWLKGKINAWGAKHRDFPLMQRVKQSFDPQNIFSPGRFVGGL
ncbi:MAG TPA: FAD-binding oxidoreductase [Candidatus Acidoferrum sp.]|nr:FAD-binding oxidoreductase [Candidatus Acidoferrum sp.]